MVDGRRYVPASADGLVDLAAIADKLIERVEIISAGASAVYESDAVAGVVNHLLRNDFEGIETRYQFGETTENDGTHQEIDLVCGIGSEASPGNAVIHASCTDADEVRMGDRAFSRKPLVNGALLGRTPREFAVFGSSNIPGVGLALSPS